MQSPFEYNFSMVFFSCVCECTAKPVSTRRGGSFFLEWWQFMPVLFFFAALNQTSWESFNATLAVVSETLRSFEPSKMRPNSRSKWGGTAFSWRSSEKSPLKTSSV